MRGGGMVPMTPFNAMAGLGISNLTPLNYLFIIYLLNNDLHQLFFRSRAAIVFITRVAQIVTDVVQ